MKEEVLKALQEFYGRRDVSWRVLDGQAIIQIGEEEFAVEGVVKDLVISFAAFNDAMEKIQDIILEQSFEKLGF
jgi:hypothetical protein